MEKDPNRKIIHKLGPENDRNVKKKKGCTMANSLTIEINYMKHS